MEEVCGGPAGPFEDLEVIRTEAGMSTARFCQLLDMPERTWHRWQAKACVGAAPKGPWLQPARQAAAGLAVKHALARPAWGHRKVWAMVRPDRHVVSQATVLRLLRDEGLLLPASYQRKRRQLAQRRKAAFAKDPTGPNQVWQLDFSEFETTTGGTWRLAGCRDYWSKYEHAFHLSPTANKHNAVAAVEMALADYQDLFGHPLRENCPADPETGELLPVVTLVTDNGGPFRSFVFEAFIACTPSWPHVRTRVRKPGQNGSRERGFGTLKYERLYLDRIDDAVMLAERAEDYRVEYNEVCVPAGQTHNPGHQPGHQLRNAGTMMDFPAVTLRSSIERPEALDTGSIIMTDLDAGVVLAGLEVAMARASAPAVPEHYTITSTSERVLNLILSTVHKHRFWSGLR